MIQAYVWHRQSTEWQAYDIFSAKSAANLRNSKAISSGRSRKGGIFDWHCIQTINTMSSRKRSSAIASAKFTFVAATIRTSVF